MIALRPYQESAWQETLGHWRAGARSVLLVAPTGAGKGTIAAHAIHAAAGKRTVFLVHREEIVRDVARRVLAMGVGEVGVRVGGETSGNPYAAVQVCSVQTLTATGRFPPADRLVTDEAHHAVAATYRAIYEAYPNVPHLGLTATPQRGDKTALGDVFDRLVVVSSVQELTRDGWLVPIDVLAPASAVDGGIAEDPVVAYERHAAGRRAVFFCAGVDHAAKVARELGEHGYPSALITGSTENRERILARFQAGEITCLVNVFVLTEGWDCPEAEVCVMARGCSSAAMFLQCVGRVLRPAEGKTRALLIDLRGVVHQHGLPDDDRAWSLSGKAIKLREGALPVRSCKACGAVFRPVAACPRCGAVLPPLPPPRVKHAELVKDFQVAPLGLKKEVFGSLVRWAATTNAKPQAVGIRFKNRFGHWPAWPIPGMARAAE